MAKPTGNPNGRPPIWNDPKDLQKAIDKYFKECEGHTVKDKKGRLIRNSYGIPIKVDRKPLTITGLALACGFGSRQCLLNYQEKDEFFDTIQRAKARVEQYAEERLYDRDGSNGAQFSLKNNFKGWDGSQNENNEALEKLDEVLSKLGGVI